MNSPSPYGLHRVLEPPGVLPQAASKVDNDPKIYDNEILIDVNILNITSASFARLKQEFGTEEKLLAKEIKKIVKSQGKYQDPVLGSGGMLIGTVEQIGKKLTENIALKVGDRIATLISLTATPLKIKSIKKINTKTDQVWIDGKAILFENSLFTKLPDDLSPEISVAIMDVAGAPAMVSKVVKEGDTVLVLGGGKAGLLCLHESMKRTGITGHTIVLEFSQARCDEIKSLGLADSVIMADATRPVEVLKQINETTKGQLTDFTVNVVNVKDSEMACILSTKDQGTIFFYNTATSFTKAALGAEAVGKPVKMLIGNGYVPGHAEIAFQILRENHKLQQLFEKLYTI